MGLLERLKEFQKKLPAFYISSKEVSDTQRLLSENTIFFERGSKALHKLRLSLLKRPERDEVLCKRSALQRDQLGSIIYLFRFVPELFLYGHHTNNVVGSSHFSAGLLYAWLICQCQCHLIDAVRFCFRPQQF